MRFVITGLIIYEFLLSPLRAFLFRENLFTLDQIAEIQKKLKNTKDTGNLRDEITDKGKKLFTLSLFKMNVYLDKIQTTPGIYMTQQVFGDLVKFSLIILIFII